jgi:hypothetical protein
MFALLQAGLGHVAPALDGKTSDTAQDNLCVDVPGCILQLSAGSAGTARLRLGGPGPDRQKQSDRWRRNDDEAAKPFEGCSPFLGCVQIF